MNKMTEKRFNELLKLYPAHDDRIKVISKEENEEFEKMWVEKYDKVKYVLTK